MTSKQRVLSSTRENVHTRTYAAFRALWLYLKVLLLLLLLLLLLRSLLILEK